MPSPRQSLDHDTIMRPGDALHPAGHGLATGHSQQPTPNRYERALARDNPDLPLASELARAARLTRPLNTDPLWDDGANVAGPIFYGFVRWILEQSRDRGITRVFFLSRDGQLLEKIARLLRVADPAYPGCHYLFGSRHAWYRALFDLANPSHRHWVSLSDRPTIEGIFDNLDLSPEALEASLIKAGHARHTWSHPLAHRERQHLWAALAQDPQAREHFSELRKARQSDVLAYFRQEGAFDHDRIALVDIGWGGNMHRAFSQLLAAGAPTPPSVTGLFFGLHNSPLENQLSYYLHPRLWQQFATVFPSVIEMLTPGDHGQTVDYRLNDDGVITPVFAPDLVAPPEAIRALHEGTLCYVSNAIAHGANPPKFDRLLRAFLVHPDAATIERWNRFHFWTWQKPASAKPPSLVARFNTPTLLCRILSPWRRVDVWPWPTASLHACLAACPRPLQTLLVFKLQIDQTAWHIFNITKAAVRRSITGKR